MSDIPQAVSFNREDFCPKCKTERSLELYNEKNQPMRYSLLLDRIEDNSQLTIDELKIPIKYMVCNRCRTKFIINWSGRHLPQPLTYGKFYKQYMSNYGGI